MGLYLLSNFEYAHIFKEPLFIAREQSVYNSDHFMRQA